MMTFMTIHECTFVSRPCENFGCRNAAGFKKYYIGRPDVSVPKPIFCEECVRTMLDNIPAEFQSSTEASAESNNFDEFEWVKEEASEEDEEIEEETETSVEKPEFRCHICGREFTTPGGLGSHMRAHRRGSL